MGLAVLFIAHDLSVVKHFCDRTGVMYSGRLVELADADELFEAPSHPYTKALLSAIPIPNPKIERSRQRIVYNKEDFVVANNEMKEISSGHFVLPFE
jgi:ABC-type oligopeptide transport system ATPase subunit